MKKLAIWIPLLLVAALTNNMELLAGPTSQRYYVTSTGTDTNDGTAATPFHTSTRAIQSLAPGDTMYIFTNPTMYTSTAHPWMCFDNGDWTNMDTRTSDYFYIMGEGTSTIINNCSQFITIDAMKPAWLHFSSMTLLNGTGSHAVYVTNSSTITFQDIYVKNGAVYNAQYGNVVEFSGTGAGAGSNDIVWRRGLIVGTHRYAMLLGGTAGYTERILIDGTIVRGDGGSSQEPRGGISNYGSTSGIDGARNNLLRGNILLDFHNSSNYAGGGDTYGVMYHPHSATDIKHYDAIAVMAPGYGTGWYYFLQGEDSAARNDIYNSVGWRIQKHAFFSSNSASSMTVRNNTIYAPNPSFTDYFNAGVQTFENSIRWRSQQSSSFDTDNFNNYFPSTSNATNSTNEITGDPFSSGNVWIASVTNSANLGTGLGGGNIGATIIYHRGGRDDTYSTPGNKDINTNRPRWPIENDWAIKSVLCSSDTGAHATSNSGNVEWRGVCATTNSISYYIWNQLGGGCPTGFCPETMVAAEPCNGTTLSPSISNITSSSLDATWTSVGGSANYVKVIDDNSDFSSPVSSLTETTASKSYSGLSSSTQYFFQVKLSTEADCAYSGTNGTTSAPAAPTGTPQKLQFQGSMTIRGVTY